MRAQRRGENLDRGALRRLDADGPGVGPLVGEGVGPAPPRRRALRRQDLSLDKVRTVAERPRRRTTACCGPGPPRARCASSPTWPAPSGWLRATPIAAAMTGPATEITTGASSASTTRFLHAERPAAARVLQPRPGACLEARARQGPLPTARRRGTSDCATPSWSWSARPARDAVRTAACRVEPVLSWWPTCRWPPSIERVGGDRVAWPASSSATGCSAARPSRRIACDATIALGVDDDVGPHDVRGPGPAGSRATPSSRRRSCGGTGTAGSPDART